MPFGTLIHKDFVHQHGTINLLQANINNIVIMYPLVEHVIAFINSLNVVCKKQVPASYPVFERKRGKKAIRNCVKLMNFRIEGLNSRMWGLNSRIGKVSSRM